jgi:hypothetical protein
MCFEVTNNTTEHTRAEHVTVMDVELDEITDTNGPLTY